MLISYAMAAQLICVFFAYAKSRFFRDMAHITLTGFCSIKLILVMCQNIILMVESFDWYRLGEILEIIF